MIRMTSVFTVALVAAIASCGAPASTPTLPDNRKPALLEENLIFFELTGECTQEAGQAPNQHKQYAQYEIWQSGFGPFASTDSFRIWEGGGLDPWGGRGIAVKGPANTGLIWVGDWGNNTYLVQGTDWRHFWIEFYDASGATIIDTVKLAGDSVLVSAGCEVEDP